MIKKQALLLGIIISSLLIFTATRLYPGGSQNDAQSVGFSWQHNYLCNLFSRTAVNGYDNPSRYWAIAGMGFLCISFALFFYSFSKKISSPSAAKVIKYFGILGMVFAFFIFTEYHNLMITLSSSFVLISLFYIAVYIFRSKIWFLKIWTIISLLVLIVCNYMYYTQSYLSILPIMQKLVFICTVVWILGLEYFTSAEDFSKKKGK